MNLYYDRRSKDPTYFMQLSYWNGVKSTSKNVKRIGKHSELLAMGIKDPKAYAQQVIEQANKEIKNGKVTTEISINYDEKVTATNDKVSSSTVVNTGYFFLQAIINQLRLDRFFQKVTAKRKITFDPYEVTRFMVYARVLDPRSRKGTYDHLDAYYENPQFEYQHIHRSMDILYENYDDYLAWLYKYSEKVIKRDSSVCYFDCTNYYFETECEDTYVDEVTGEIMRGLRRYGPSKEHRPNPLVEMGLFMDSQGIPITMCIANGSDSEQTLAIPLEKKLTQMLNGQKFIYCADAGLNSVDIRLFNSMNGRAFIVTQSVKKLSNVLQQAVFNDYDYHLLSDGSASTIKDMKEFDRFAEDNKELYNDRVFKLLTADRAVDTGLTEVVHLKNGKTKTVPSKALLKQTIIITFSRKMMEYQRHIRNNQIDRARVLLKNIDPDTYKKGPHDVTRFIKRKSKSKSGEEVTDEFFLDQDRIAEEEKYDGYYAIATNLQKGKDETEAHFVKSVLSINAERNEIEDCFRVLKSSFSSRPIFARTKPRITAHFMICYTALLVYRLLEIQVNSYGAKISPQPVHFTVNNIIDTLKAIGVSDFNGMFYKAEYKGSQTLDALNSVYDLRLDRKYYQIKELNRKIRKIL